MTDTLKPLTRFVLRTPALPFDVLARWSALPDVDARRAELQRLVADPVVREALYVASPELEGQIASWHAEPESPSGVAIERALVRYLSRMASRSTPFGLFAAVSVCATGATTKLHLSAGRTRHTRFDNELVFALCNQLVRDPDVRARVRYQPNSSAYVAAGRLRYAEARAHGGAVAYHLVAVDRTPYVDALLERAKTGATCAELAAVLCEDPEIEQAEAIAFIDEVIDAQLLVPDLAPVVTGREPADAVVDALEALGLPERAAPLRAASETIRALDEHGGSPDAYRALHTQLAAALPIDVEANRLFQIDMFRPAPDVVLGDAVIADLRRAVDVLRQLTPPPVKDVWDGFRDKFLARYETREVPLLEVLDQETGIGFGDAPGRSAPLLADVAFPTKLVPMSGTLQARDVYLMVKVSEALRTGARELVLTDGDIKKLSRETPVETQDIVAASAQIVASSAEAIARGDYQLRVIGAGSGAGLLGRFCHGSPDVRSLTEECLRAEEARHPDAIFAEIVHLPEGRIGNLILLPVLRQHEIVYLGTSGAPAENQISVDDLLVSVIGNRVVLRSRRLGREVIPRMTTAHNWMARGLAPYRFLCAHAEQNDPRVYWAWGVLNEMPFLPRLRHGKLVLSRARWTLIPSDLAPLEAAFAGWNAAKTPEQTRAIRARAAEAVRELRRRLDLPRWIVLSESDNELPIDLDNELMVDSAAHLLKGKKTATLYELYPAPDQLCVRGETGAYCHELIAMFTKTGVVPAPRFLGSDGGVERRFVPGSRWLYLKLYTGEATADALLRDYIAPALREAEGLFERSFYIRYSDPDWHLRLRFEGDPARLAGQLLPLLYRALAPAVAQGLVYKITVDTYEREVERYGGADGIAVAEKLFAADSACALSILETCHGDAGGDAIWRITLRGLDKLLDDLGFTLAGKLAIAGAARDSFGAEVGMDTAMQKRLGDKFRAHRADITDFLAASDDAVDHPFAPAITAIAERSRRLAPVAAELHALASAGRLTCSIEDLAHSLMHMYVNRMIRTAPRAHEVVLYDLLRRHYDGLAARQRKAG